ncbi:hypothetical protein MKX01_031092 [Papaver californicum]|nr:hypothetical protein MKX01_031092 [Papaver californicum]
MEQLMYDGERGDFSNARREENNELPMEEVDVETRGSIAFFSTYRPPVPLDIFSCPIPPTSSRDELGMTDGKSYNYSGTEIPPEALMKIFTYTSLTGYGTQDDINSGRITGMIFVSERENLELLHIAIRRTDVNPPRDLVHSLADIFRKSPSPFDGVRMEDSGCFADNHLIFVSTKEPATRRRQPWTAVYKTNLMTGETDRLTPRGHADLSPSVSPSGKKIAVASFEGTGGWDGAIEDQKTDIYVMNVEEPYDRRMVVKNGGWPTWGTDNIIFFHRKDENHWGVYRADIGNGGIIPVTPDNIDAFTPAAINATTVAVVTIRKNSEFSVVNKEAQYRHIEIFCTAGEQEPMRITQIICPTSDHFNPFVIEDRKIGDVKRIGYHRSTSEALNDEEEIRRQFQIVTSPDPEIGLFRVGGGFPTFSKNGSRLAFVDNDFKIVWVLDNGSLNIACELSENSVFSPVWDQNDRKDKLYVCIGPSFSAVETVNIHVIRNVSRYRRQLEQLTDGFNNAFPSSSPDGKHIVYRSTRDGYKNLYIMDAERGVMKGRTPKRLTNGDWTDTQCQWSPKGNWIVFSSTREKPPTAAPKDHDLDPGYFAVYLVKWDAPDVWVRVIGSGSDLGGHVNHPFFSPDGRSIVVTSDLAAVSVDPISLPIITHSARPYGDIFTVDIDPVNIAENDDRVKPKVFKRITHSRFENSTGTWTNSPAKKVKASRDLLKDEELEKSQFTKVACPYRGGCN